MTKICDKITANPIYEINHSFPSLYNPKTKENAIYSLTRISKPGLRQYTNIDTMPRVLNGLGIAILSTSKGVITNKEARKENVGGEVLCYVQ